MVVTGSGFGANARHIAVTYDDARVLSGVTTDSQGAFSASFLVPPSQAGLHKIQVSDPITPTATPPSRGFTVSPDVVLSSPYGHVGMNLHVIGQGFEPATTITLTYDDLTRAAVLTDDSGSFRLEFSVPISTQGDHLAALYDEQGNKFQLPFLVENESPSAPSLLSPSPGEHGGLFGGFRPTVNWSPVDDPSGVAYTLVIATDPNFYNPVLIEEGLASPARMLSKDQALSRGEYYWRVKAIDQASNEGPWSPASVMHSGIIPFWMVPAVAVLVVLTSGGGVSTYIYRRRLRAREETIIPELLAIRSGTIAGLPPPSFTAALGAGLRRALPIPSPKGKIISLEEQVQIGMVKDFLDSIPVLKVSHDLVWLEELIETQEGPGDDTYERVLDGQIEVLYHPGWMQHPAYQALQQAPSAQAFVQNLAEHAASVNDCAADTLELLWKIHTSAETAFPLNTLEAHRWQFVLSVAQSAIAWYLGIYLEHPSTREYSIQPTVKSGGDSLFSLLGNKDTPFVAPIVEALIEEEVLLLRDLHIELRQAYGQDEQVQVLATKLALTNGQREQLLSTIARHNGTQ